MSGGRERRLNVLRDRIARLKVPEPVESPADGGAVSILDAMRLFGETFAGESWAAWRAFLRALFGLLLDGRELETFRRYTGRQTAPGHGFREAWLIVGRRGGKSRISALVAVFLAAFRDYGDVLAPGERGVVMCIASDRTQAQVVFRYVLALLESVPELRKLIAKRRTESVELLTGIAIEVHTASWRSTRGYTVVGAVLDEVAFWRADDSANPDREIVAALKPGMATVPTSVLLAITTPYSRRGEVWRAFEQHHGRDESPVLVWKAETRAMNPAVDEAVIAAAYEEDAVAAAAEWGAQFRQDVEAFLVPEAVDAVVVPGRLELAPAPGVQYVAFVDPSGGSQDSMTLAIAHAEEREGQTVVVLDCVRERRPPFSPDDVVREFAETLKAYSVSTVHGDRYAGEWPRERFSAHGITYQVSDKTKSDLYRELLPLVNSGRAALLDHRVLRAQLEGLERRVARGGKDSVDHPPGGRDDVANSAAGALVFASAEGGYVTPWVAAGNLVIDIRTGQPVAGKAMRGDPNWLWSGGWP